MNTLDRSALQQGAGVSLVFAVPFSVGSSLLAGNEGSSPWVAVLWLAALGGFALGAGVAAWAQRTGYPLMHGLVCAGGTYVAAQAVFIAIKLLRGGSVNWISVLFVFTMVITAGLVGGGLGSALRKRGFVPTAERNQRRAVEDDRAIGQTGDGGFQ